MPTQWTCTFSFEAVGSMYKAAVRQIQPRGPYLIGGWSLGGMHAFEVARQLLLEGQCVRGLLLIDAPSPALLSDVPEPTLQVLESIGLFGALHKAGIRGAALDRAQQHLLHSIRSLNRYTPMPMDPDHRPEAVSIIWGARGVFEELGGKVVEAVALRGRGERRRDERCTEEMDRLQGWMSAPRKEFGPNGWERLLAGAEINCHRTEGDHFSMMNPPLVCTTPIEKNLSD
jgi:thioesterase domain-containing protein